MPSKKAARKANASGARSGTGSVDLPNWRSKLMSMPGAERCRSQRDLARSLELIDLQLSLFKGTTPPSNFGERDAIKAVLAALEVEFLRFHQNTAVPLYPANRYPDILPWMGKNQMRSWTMLTKLQEIHADKSLGLSSQREGVETILGPALQMLFMHYVACSSSNSSNPLNFARFANFWSGWQGRWDELEEDEGDEVLAEFGSRLTINDLRHLSRGVVICMLGFDARQKRNPEAAIFVGRL